MLRIHTTGYRLAFRKHLQCASALTGIALLASLASAQTAAAGQAVPAADSAPSVNEIVVTGSRIPSGASAPTPITVLSAESINKIGASTPVASLRLLPALSNTATSQKNPSSGGASNGGASFLDLRALGANRTLTLFNGRRVVPATSTGLVDANVLPSALLERVDIVTAGASAVYGSDAVAGVVNFIINPRFEGLRAKIQGGVTGHNDNTEGLITAAAGHSFLEDRLHVVVGGEHFRNNGIGPAARAWDRQGVNIIANPTGTPAFLLVPNARIVATTGGLVTTGIGGTAAANASFRGIMFGPGGAPQTYDFGTNTTTNTQQGGSGFDTTTTQPLNRPNHRSTVYGQVTYDINDDWSAFGEAMFGTVGANYVNGPNLHTGATALTIQRDNAYLPAAIRNQMVASGVTGLTVNRADAEDGYLYSINQEIVRQGTVGINGKIGSWDVDAFYSHGSSHAKNRVLGNFNKPNYALAVDAVVNPANGQIVCRSSLTAPTNGCVPFNIFGQGSPSAAAVAYATGTAVAITRNKLDNFGVNVSGTLFQGWAGPAKGAVGYEARRDRSVTTSDLISQSQAYNIQNVLPWAASQTTHEAYAEAEMPLARDLPFVKDFTLNGAVRVADYSTSGRGTTWKVGTSYEPFAGVRIRATRSRDFRAPSLSEQFAAGTEDVFTGVDPFKGNIGVSRVRQVTSGNSDLDPEVSHTTTVGVVWRPTTLAGLTASVDYYKIDISGAIASLATQTLLNNCFAGVNTACANFIRDAGGNLTQVRLRPINFAKATSEGVDLDLTYTPPVADWFGWDGALTLRSITGYLKHQTLQNPGGPVVENAGVVGNFNNPKWRSVVQATYSQGPIDLLLQGRYVGGGVIDNTRTPAQLLNNSANGRTYLDGQIAYKPMDHIEVYLNIQNLLDKDPPVFPAGSASNPTETNPSLYDVAGRMFRVGLNLRY